MFPSPLMSPNILRTDPVEPLGLVTGSGGGLFPLANPPGTIGGIPAGWSFLNPAVSVGGLTESFIPHPGVFSRARPSIVVIRTYEAGTVPAVAYKPLTDVT